MRKKIFLFCLLSLIVISCKSQQVVQKEVATIDTIQIIKQERIIDTVFLHVPKIVTNDKNCDSLCNSQLDAFLKTLRISHTSEVEKYKLQYDEARRALVHVNEQLTKENKSVKSSQITTNTIIQKEYRTRFIVKVFAWWGVISLLVLIVWLVISIIKKKIRLL